MSRDVEKMLRSMPLRRPSRRLNERVMGELRGAAPSGRMSLRWAGWLSGASAAAAMLAVGLSVTALVRTAPTAGPATPGSAADTGLTEGQATPGGEIRDGRAEVSGGPGGGGGARLRPEERLNSMPRFRGEFLRQPFEQPLGQPANERLIQPRRGGTTPINPTNGEPSQVQ